MNVKTAIAVRPENYRAIAIWHGSSGAGYIHGLQVRALAEHQPVDVVCVIDGKWLRASNLHPGHWFHNTLRGYGVNLVLDPALQLAAQVEHVATVRAEIVAAAVRGSEDLKLAQATLETLRALAEDRADENGEAIK